MLLLRGAREDNVRRYFKYSTVDCVFLYLLVDDVGADEVAGIGSRAGVTRPAGDG